MNRLALLPLAAAAIALSACEAQIGSPAGQNASAELKVENTAEEGRIALKAPGVDISVNIPQGLRDLAQIDPRTLLVPPDVNFGGLSVQGNEAGGGVELRFTSSQAPAELARWYQSAERTANFAIDNAAQEGGATVLRGHTTGAEAGNEGAGFTVRLAPGPNGGSEGRLVLAEAR